MGKFRNRSDRGLYRSRNGAFAGVCRGLAEYFDFSVFWLRLLALLVVLFSGIWPGLIVYFIAALVMKPEPVRPFSSKAEEDFYDDYVSSRYNAARRLKRRYNNLDRRIRRMEDTVTGREYDWDRKMGAR
jgi:phage shock protein C